MKFGNRDTPFITLFVSIWFLMIVFEGFAIAVPGTPTSFARFADDTLVTVYIDEGSFAACGFNTSTHKQAQDLAVNRLIHAWQSVSGNRLTFKYEGRITRTPRPDCNIVIPPQVPGVCTNVNLNEVIITCNPDTNQNIVALAISKARPSGDFGGGKPLQDRGVLELLKYVNGTPNTFVWGHPSSVADHDFYTIMLHEMGHMIGMAHTCELLWLPLCSSYSQAEQTIMKRTVMYPDLSEGWPWNRTGPQTLDITRSQAAFNNNPRNDLALKYGASSDGTYWTTYSTSESNNYYQTPAAAYGPGGQGTASIAYFNKSSKYVQWKLGTGSSFNTRSLYTNYQTYNAPGLAVSGNNVMIAWANTTFNETSDAGRRIEVLFSSDAGVNWQTKTSIVANTAGRVEMAVTPVSGYTMWQVAWVDAITFEAKVALSYNSGQTWTVNVFQNYQTGDTVRAAGGIDIACNDSDVCQLAYRDANTSSSLFMRSMSLHYAIAFLFGTPMAFSDSGGPVVVNSNYVGGMAPRVFMQYLNSIANIDYHANYGQDSTNNDYRFTARAFRKLQANSEYPNGYSFINIVRRSPMDLTNPIYYVNSGGTKYLFTYFFNPVY